MGIAHRERKVEGEEQGALDILDLCKHLELPEVFAG